MILKCLSQALKTSVYSIFHYLIFIKVTLFLERIDDLIEFNEKKVSA